MEVVNFEDKNLKIVKLQRGSYIIDGEYHEIESYNCKELTVRNIDDIRIVTMNKFVDYYLNQDERLSVVEYQDKVQEFFKHESYIEEEDDASYWNDIDVEHAYKKFIRSWVPIYKTIQSISKPIQVQVKNTILDTGNKYITNCYCNGKEDYTLYTYNRPAALLDIVGDKFTSLGMVYENNINYGATTNKKVWGNSSHSCIEYVTAFGHYIFKGYKNTYIKKGTLDEMMVLYNEDKETLENEIQLKYNLHFGNSVDINKEKLYNDLKNLKKSVDDLNVKQKSIQDHRSCVHKINNIIGDLERCILNRVTK